MLYSFDLKFFYFNILRFIFLYRVKSVRNSFNIFMLNKIILFFPMRDLDNVNPASAYNYYYLIKYFFGARAFFTSYRSVFSLGVTTYNLNIQTIFKKHDMFTALLFFANDIMPKIRNDFEYFYNVGNSLNSTCMFVIQDMSIFIEKKTNIGLFHLNDFMHFKMFFNHCNLDSLNLFKTFIR